MIKRTVLIAIGLILVLTIAYGIYLAAPHDDYLIERTGEIVEAEVTEEEREIDRS